MGLFKKEKDEDLIARIAGLDYDGGIPAIEAGSACLLFIKKNTIYVKSLFQKYEISYNMFTDLRFESKSEIEQRITATRMALLGPFALAFKKDQKSTERFLSIDYDEGSGLINTIVFSGTTASKAYNFLYQAYTDYLKEHPKKKETTVDDPYEELKKLKELLDMGIITQEEFDAKKKEFLNL